MLRGSFLNAVLIVCLIANRASWIFSGLDGLVRLEPLQLDVYADRRDSPLDLSAGLDIPESEREGFSKQLTEEYSCSPVFLSDDIADRYYNGFSNSILWPLFHYRSYLTPCGGSKLSLL